MSHPLPVAFDFSSTPFAHQERELARCWDRPAFALFWEMGTGKSFETIHNAVALFQAGAIDGLVVIAPKGVYRNWEGELAKHLPEGFPVDVTVWGRAKRPRSKPATCLHVFLVNVEAMPTSRGKKALSDWLDRYSSLLVVDESTSVKNHRAQRTTVIAELARKAPYRRILTGSPVTQSPLDLFGQLSILQSEPLGFRSFYAFRNRYAQTRKRTVQVFDKRKGKVVERKFDEVVGYRRLDELQAKLAPISSRVLKSECLDLPEKIYIRREVDLTPEQRSVYVDLTQKAKAELGGLGRVTTPQAITQILRLHQVACGFVRNDDGEDRPLDSRRLAALTEAIEELGDQKVILWAPYRYSIAEIANHLVEQYGAASVETYFGDTTSEQRARAIERFQTDDGCRFFVGNPQTAGYGLTLTAASAVIYFANSWKLEERMQSEDRAHRIGQTRAVTYVDLVAPGTVDERILDALRAKHDIASEVLGEQWRTWIE